MIGFKDLSFSLKILVILGWLNVAWYASLFCLGLLLGALGL